MSPPLPLSSLFSRGTRGSSKVLPHQAQSSESKAIIKKVLPILRVVMTMR